MTTKRSDRRRLLLAVAAGLLFSAACLTAALNPANQSECLATASELRPAML
ncbi:MAG: hypothetical protein V4618_02310 [Pseudomonadota bacterium]